MPRRKSQKIDIKSRQEAKTFLLKIPPSTLRNLIAIVLYRPADAESLAKIVGTGLRNAEYIIKRYSERGIIKTVKFRK